MQAIIRAQGEKPFDLENPELAPHQFEVLAPGPGVVNAIDNLRLARIARLAGAPQARGAGVDLLARIGDRVEQGQPLYRVYAAYRSECSFAHQCSERDNGYSIGQQDRINRLNVEF